MGLGEYVTLSLEDVLQSFGEGTAGVKICLLFAHSALSFLGITEGIIKLSSLFWDCSCISLQSDSENV